MLYGAARCFLLRYAYFAPLAPVPLEEPVPVEESTPVEEPAPVAPEPMLDVPVLLEPEPMLPIEPDVVLPAPLVELPACFSQRSRSRPVRPTH